MSESIQGIVANVSRKNGRGAIQLQSSDIWYGAFNTSQVGNAATGDSVGFNFKVADKGGRTFHNIVGSVSPLDEQTKLNWVNRTEDFKADGQPSQNVSSIQSSTAPRSQALKPVELDRNRSIIRQNSLSNAVNCLAATGTLSMFTEDSLEDLKDTVISLAAHFEAYSSGDLDKKSLEPEASDSDWRTAAHDMLEAS